MVRIKMLGSDTGVNKIELNGQDITKSVAAFEINANQNSIAEVKLTLMADVDVELEASLLDLEKIGHVRFRSLATPRAAFVRTR
jgi:hypothetical protein